MEYKDYYAALGVKKDASQDDIKQAYRRMARKFHPDVSKEANAEEKFKNVQEAYEVLKDPEKRTAYDQLGSEWQSGQSFRPPPGWNEGARTRYTRQGGNGGTQFAEDDAEGFSDFFSQLFGNRGRRGFERGGFEQGGFEDFQQRGNDQRAKVAISLEDAFHGGSKTLQLQVPEIDPVTGQMNPVVKTLKVTIPAGAKQGQQLRLAQQGMPGMGGAPAGDLYLELEIQPHKLFSLEGQDIYISVPVTPWEAALGADIKIPTLGGTVGMKLAPDSQAGQKLRLKGRGMPGKPTPGDQYAVLKIMTPPATTETQKELYEKMAKDMPFNPRKDWVV